MTKPSKPTRVTYFWKTLFAIVMLSFLLFSLFDLQLPFKPEANEPESTDQSTAESSEATTTPTSLSRVFLDPKTGQITQSQSLADAEELSAELTNSLSRSSEGLVVESAPGGGQMVRLQGRFRSLRVYSASDSSIRCLTAEDSEAGITAVSQSQSQSQAEGGL